METRAVAPRKAFKLSRAFASWVFAYSTPAVKRNRWFYFVAGCVVVPLGLASRRYATLLPEFIALYAGDTLWALEAFCGFGFIFQRWSSLRVAAVALVFSYAVEISQLYHAPWIDHLRRTWLGGLILGYGFLWSDILCYTVGVMVGATVDVLLPKSPRGDCMARYKRE